MMTQKFILHWRGGSTETIEGESLLDAVQNAGIGAGALPALDWYEPVKDRPEGEIGQAALEQNGKAER